MTILVTGSEGNIGRRIMAALGDVKGVDRAETADIVADLGVDDLVHGPVGQVLRQADAVLHLAASADPDAPPYTHLAAAVATARLIHAAAYWNVPRLVLASSDWAAPTDSALAINPYGRSKRAAEALAAIYDAMPGQRALALRIGWVPAAGTDLAAAPAWLRANHWDDDRLLSEFERALRR